MARSEEPFLRTPPNERNPNGRRVGVPGRLHRIFTRLHAAAPGVFADGALTPHCYRASLGSFVDARWSRAVTKEVLGHKGRKTPTDHYVYIDPATIRDVICAYEAHLLAHDPTITAADSPEQGGVQP